MGIVVPAIAGGGNRCPRVRAGGGATMVFAAFCNQINSFATFCFCSFQGGYFRHNQLTILDICRAKP